MVYAPAHQFLYSPFDERIGHFRRYDRESLLASAPPKLTRETLVYLDSAGLLASLAQFVLRQGLPTKRQLATWDRLLVPVSRLLDPILLHRVGKSVLGVWRQPVG